MKKLVTRLFILVLLLSVFIPNAFTQIKVFDNGYVGINYTTNTPLSKLVLNSQGTSAYQAMFYNPLQSVSGGTFYAFTESGSSTGKHLISILGSSGIGTGNYNYGIKGNAYSSTSFTTGRTYGVYGYAGGASAGYNYGVYGMLAGTNYGAAVFGTTSGDCYVGGKYAGYFYGNVKVTSEMWANVVTESDERIKSNIVSIHPDQSVANIKALNPVTYNLKQREINNANDSTSVVKYYDANCQFFQKPKFGLLAQEVQKVYPDLVYEDEDGNLGIDYTGLIPVLISAVQEQQKRIEELEKKVKDNGATVTLLSEKILKLYSEK